MEKFPIAVELNRIIGKIQISEDYFIKLYGEMEGKLKWKQTIKNYSNSKTIENYIRLYGEREGIIKYNLYQEKNSYTNTKKYYIEKYGEKEGIKKWYELTVKKIKRTYSGYSFISQILFEILLDKIIDKNNVYFFNHQNEKQVLTFKPDFVYHNKIIEFYGDIWHSNPNIFTEEQTSNFKLNITAKEIWKRDEIRINKLKNSGYEILIIWEKDFNEKKEECIKQCIKFLNI